ncbi:hypothetical protein EYF80_004166 [Liparis tanakae]|uniref:Uncharacterized protein n=1 Tax=Liparis tanakae TaxID=230148 RepID=A0A4Z2J7F5_9TELE|nr:hypothetical protein EYF80_004166 [Liparis tanakae]
MGAAALAGKVIISSDQSEDNLRPQKELQRSVMEFWQSSTREDLTGAIRIKQKEDTTQTTTQDQESVCQNQGVTVGMRKNACTCQSQNCQDCHQYE